MRTGTPHATTTEPTPAGEGPAPWGLELAAHDRWLRTAVAARVGEAQAVDEVMQEVALAAVALAVRPSEVDSPGAWLYRIAVRKVWLYRRAHGRRSRLLGRYAAGRPGEAVPGPLEWLLREERRGLVRQALRLLPARDAEILLLKYTENWSYRDLARHLGVGEAAVEARLHRARRKLRDAVSGTAATEGLE